MDSSELDLAEKAGVDPDEERVEEVEEVNGKKEEPEVHSSEKETQPQEGGFVGEFKQYSDDNEKQGEDYNSWYDDEANTDPNPNKKRRFQETINQEGDGTEKKKPKMIGIVPMAPVEILHDMMGTDLSYEVADPIMPQGPRMPMLFMARVMYQDNEFVGQGPSETFAKNICAEQVLQFITTQSCSKQETTAEPSTEEEASSAVTPETPWSALASLAMFKMFNDWQSQGYTVPPELMAGSSVPMTQRQPHQQHMSASRHRPQPTEAMGANMEAVIKETMNRPLQPGTKRKNKWRENIRMVRGPKELPWNFREKNPIQLLNEMRGPGVCAWEDLGKEGVTPNMIFTVGVRVEAGGFSYTGRGRSKKEAKIAAAVAALSSLYPQYTCGEVKMF